jgi:hypothetical protein
VDEGY